MTTTTTETTALLTSTAGAAWKVRTQLDDGRTLVSLAPEAGDLEALQEALGRAPTPAEVDAFAVDYRAEIERLARASGETLA